MQLGWLSHFPGSLLAVGLGACPDGVRVPRGGAEAWLEQGQKRDLAAFTWPLLHPSLSLACVCTSLAPPVEKTKFLPPLIPCAEAEPQERVSTGPSLPSHPGDRSGVSFHPAHPSLPAAAAVPGLGHYGPSGGAGSFQMELTGSALGSSEQLSDPAA